MNIDLNGLLDNLKRDKRKLIPIPRENIIAFIEAIIELPNELKKKNDAKMQELVKEINAINQRIELSATGLSELENTAKENQKVIDEFYKDRK